MKIEQITEYLKGLIMMEKCQQSIFNSLRGSMYFKIYNIKYQILLFNSNIEVEHMLVVSTIYCHDQRFLI